MTFEESLMCEENNIDCEDCIYNISLEKCKVSELSTAMARENLPRILTLLAECKKIYDEHEKR